MGWLVIVSIRIGDFRSFGLERLEGLVKWYGLKDTGSIYLHCDPTAHHYLKLLMDSIFGAGNFRNEIIWRRTGAHNSADRDNLQLLCAHCNRVKGDRPQEYLVARLREMGVAA